MRNFNDVKTYAPLFREMADAIEQCLNEGNHAKLVGCLSAIFFVNISQLGPFISALKEKVDASEVEMSNEDFAEDFIDNE